MNADQNPSADRAPVPNEPANQKPFWRLPFKRWLAAMTAWSERAAKRVNDNFNVPPGGG